MTKPTQAATRQQSRLDAFKLRAAKELVKLRESRVRAVNAAARRHADIERDWWATIPEELATGIEEIATKIEVDVQLKADEETAGE